MQISNVTFKSIICKALISPSYSKFLRRLPKHSFIFRFGSHRANKRSGLGHLTSHVLLSPLNVS